MKKQDFMYVSRSIYKYSGRIGGCIAVFFGKYGVAKKKYILSNDVFKILKS